MLAGRASQDDAIALRDALAREKEKSVRKALTAALAELDLASDDPQRRLGAIAAIDSEGSERLRPKLEALTAKHDDGTYAEPDPRVRDAAAKRGRRAGAQAGRLRHDGRRPLRPQHGEHLAPLVARAGDHVRPDARHQHGARRDAHARRVRDVRDPDVLPRALPRSRGVVPPRRGACRAGDHDGGGRPARADA